MKLCAYVIASQVEMFKEFLAPSAGEFDLVIRYGNEVATDDRDSPEFKDSIRRKLAFLLEVARDSAGEIIVHAEADVIFCRQARDRIEQLVAGVDVAAMQAGMRVNPGFMALRVTPSTLRFLETMVADPGRIIDRTEMADALALNIYKRMVHWEPLPYREFWNLGEHYRKGRDKASMRWIAVPENIRVFHACFCRDMELKLWLLGRVKELLAQPAPRLLLD